MGEYQDALREEGEIDNFDEDEIFHDRYDPPLTDDSRTRAIASIIVLGTLALSMLIPLIIVIIRVL